MAAVSTLKDVRREHLANPGKFELVTPTNFKPTENLFTEADLLGKPSGHSFMVSQLHALGADPAKILRQLRGTDKSVKFLSTFGGLPDPHNPDASACFGAHTGHGGIHKQMYAAADALHALDKMTFAAHATGGCDGIWQGTEFMFHSLPHRNSLFELMAHQQGAFYYADGALAFGACDKEGPALAASIAHMRVLSEVHKKRLIGIIVPGGVMMADENPKVWDTGKVQTANAQFAFGKMTLADAAFQICSACNPSKGACQFFGTGASQQAVLVEGLGLGIPHSACVPSETGAWKQVASMSAKFLSKLLDDGYGMQDILGPGSIKNAMAVMAATGASTNMFMHLAFVARAAGLEAPSVQDYQKVFKQVPRFLRVLPNGPSHPDYPNFPKGFPTAFFWAAGGVPEIMNSLAEMGMLDLDAMTVTGQSVGANLKSWNKSAQRNEPRRALKQLWGVDPKHVIMDPSEGIPGSYAFPKGNLFDLSICKSGSIKPEHMVDGVYDKVARARVFTDEKVLRQAILDKKISSGDVIVFISRGPLATGCEEVYEFTSIAAHIPEMDGVSILTDARFSGVTTGACIGHVTKEAFAGGEIGKLMDGDHIHIYINNHTGESSVNLCGDNASGYKSADFGSQLLAKRQPRNDIRRDPRMPPVVKGWGSQMANGNETFMTGFFPQGWEL